MAEDRWFRFFISVPLLVSLACAGSTGPLDGSESVEVDQEAVGTVPDVINPSGEWKMVEFTGSIEDERIGGGLEILCDYFKTTYQADLESGDTYIRFLEKKSDPDLGSIPQDLFDAMSSPGEGGGLFVFSFAFDNGYHTNQVLEGLGVQAQYSQLIPEFWDFAFGVWTEQGVEGEIQLGAPGGGNSEFIVTGQFVTEKRLEGTWSFEETTALPGGESPECNTAASGEGNWVAQKKP